MLIYHFRGRLHVAPQVRIETDRNSMWSNGFTSLEECKAFATNICFSVTIWEYDSQDVRRIVFNED